MSDTDQHEAGALTPYDLGWREGKRVGYLEGWQMAIAFLDGLAMLELPQPNAWAVRYARAADKLREHMPDGGWQDEGVLRER